MKQKIGIIFAGDQEFAPLLALLDSPTIVNKAMLTFYLATIHDMEIVTLYCGVCKTNAAIATQILIDHFDCKMVINTGTAGGIQRNIKTFDTVVSTESAYWDVAEDILTDFHPWMDTVYFKANQYLIDATKKAIQEKDFKHVYFGKIITGESFIEDKNRAEIEQNFNPLCVDMETASIAHTCYVNNIPYIAIRTITDTVDNQGIDEFDLNCDKASKISVDITLALLEKISKDQK
ncbi:phosphoglycerate transporter [Myroides marinus]|uniref:adenosylhomocysteine nucleosidase n=1 Tax=Myroides marinus TaxID=703342 RepID=A0A165QKQ1_9FLAO|nr:5'-methylthioadenosine/adenosylhomocysteine nucleosidase [Myroides marinus]KZE75419.1 phosphoglycerate transporter [Myroides marinus]